MFIIAANWYDNLNRPFITEYYKETTDATEILTFYAKQKSIFNRTIIGEELDSLLFSDGTRVVLSLLPVKSHVNEEVIEYKGQIDLKAGTVTMELGDTHESEASQTINGDRIKVSKKRRK